MSKYRPSNIERQLNLIAQLRNTELGLTKQEIRQTVLGYEAAKTESSFEKMFQRDKKILRDIGIELETKTKDGSEVDVYYRIEDSQTDLPNLDLDSAEFEMIAAAVHLWSGSDPAFKAGRALTKFIPARNVDPDSDLGQTTDSTFPVLTVERGTLVADLLDAIEQRRAVSFTYRAASTGVLSQRRVQPWELQVMGGGWYLVGYDTDRKAPRAFRLSRVRSDISTETAAQSYDIPETRPLSDLLIKGGLVAPVIALRPNTGAALRLRATKIELGQCEHPPGWDLVSLEDADLIEIARTLAAAADAVVVLEPPELRNKVKELLTAIANMEDKL